MGCVSSKLFRKELEKEKIRVLDNGVGDNYPNHVVSLTSTTYGVLNLEKRQQQQLWQQQQQQKLVEDCVVVTQETGDDGNKSGKNDDKLSERSPPREKPEVINAWELMEGLEEDADVSVVAETAKKKSPKARGILLKGFGDVDARSPLKFLNQIGSPRKAKSVGGKENRSSRANSQNRRPDYFTPNNPILRMKKSGGGDSTNCKAMMSLNFGAAYASSPAGSKRESFGAPISPVFDPDLVASYEKELSLEGEEIKRMVSPAKKQRNSPESQPILARFEEKCPPGGENAVVIYTTTLRGIRRTFEDCNKVRSVIESHLIRIIERDVSMDSGFREELRRLMGTKEVKVPLVFVRGRLVGGAEEVVKLEEEGKLGLLFDGIPRAFAGGCGGCAGFRFVMCVGCSGSCKVLDGQQKKMVRCGECNENGLVQCPICC